MVSSTVLSVVAVAALGAQGALHNTRSRHNAADIALRRSNNAVGALAPRDVAIEANNSKRATKKRCGAHDGGGSSSSSAASSKSTGKSSSSSGGGSNSSGSGSSGSSSSGSGSSSSSSGGSGQSKAGLEWVGIPSDGFVGTQSGGIMSWFQADSGQDSTNGVSWCNVHYQNDMPGFAPDMKVMSPSLATWGSNPGQWEADAKKWCGLEAEVTVNGKVSTMYIIDAFDPAWVKTPASIDVLYNAFTDAYQNPNYDKNIVATGVSWKLTGYRKPEYSFQN